MVEKDSAILGLTGGREIRLGVEADHSNICRFESKDDEKYKDVWMALRQMLLQAIELLPDRQKSTCASYIRTIPVLIKLIIPRVP